MFRNIKNKLFRQYAKRFWSENDSKIIQKLVKSEAKIRQKLVESGVKIRL